MRATDGDRERRAKSRGRGGAAPILAIMRWVRASQLTSVIASAATLSAALLSSAGGASAFVMADPAADDRESENASGRRWDLTDAYSRLCRKQRALPC